CQVLWQGLQPGTDSVLLDSAGDGLREMAAFLTGRQNLAAIGIVAHGAPGEVSLGSALLNGQAISTYAAELALVGTALAPGGELDLWSCDVGAGQAGAALVHDLEIATGAGVAAADHPIGASARGGNWDLNVRTKGASGSVPFSGRAQRDFQDVLGTW